MTFQPLKSMVLGTALLLSAQASVHAAGASTQLSEASQLPLAMSVAAPALLLSGGVMLTVVSVQATAEGVQWVVERTVDGVRTVVRFAAKGAGLASVAVGTVITTTAMASGTLLSVAGQAIAFVPREVGKALLHTERLSD